MIKENVVYAETRHLPKRIHSVGGQTFLQNRYSLLHLRDLFATFCNIIAQLRDGLDIGTVIVADIFGDRLHIERHQLAQPHFYSFEDATVGQ